MLVFETPADLATSLGRELGVSGWLVVSQELITQFAEVTRDFTWMHTDPARAAREMPGGTTIAHGYLTLAVGSGLLAEIYTVKRHGRVFNYGVDQLRFPAPVPAGGRIRLRLRLASVEKRDDAGLLFRLGITTELAGSERPAAVYEMLVLMYPERR